MKATNIRPITELKNHTKELLREVAHTGESILITQNGKAAAVLMDVGEHERLRDTLAMLKILAQSQDSLRRGERTYTTGQARKAAMRVIETQKKNAG